MPRFMHFKLELAQRPADCYAQYYAKKTETEDGLDKLADELSQEFIRPLFSKSVFTDYHTSTLIPEGVKSFKLLDSQSTAQVVLSCDKWTNEIYEQVKCLVGKGIVIGKLESKLAELYESDKTRYGCFADFYEQLRKAYILDILKPKARHSEHELVRAKQVFAYLAANAFSAEHALWVSQTDGRLLLKTLPNNRFYCFQKIKNAYRNIESARYQLVRVNEEKAVAIILVRAVFDIKPDGNLRQFPKILMSVKVEGKGISSEEILDFFRYQVFSEVNNPFLENKIFLIRRVGWATKTDLLRQQRIEQESGCEFPASTEFATGLAQAAWFGSWFDIRKPFSAWLYRHRLSLVIGLFILLAALTVAVLTGGLSIIPSLPFLSSMSIGGVCFSASALSAALESLLGFMLFMGGIAISACVSSASPKSIQAKTDMSAKLDDYLRKSKPSSIGSGKSSEFSPADYILADCAKTTTEGAIGHSIQQVSESYKNDVEVGDPSVPMPVGPVMPVSIGQGVSFK